MRTLLSSLSVLAFLFLLPACESPTVTSEESANTASSSSPTNSNTGSTGTDNETGSERNQANDDGAGNSEHESNDGTDDDSGSNTDRGTDTGPEGCTPGCEDKECGDDGCGGTCGLCAEGVSCTDGACGECTPSCVDQECGENGCGGTCGECADAQACLDGACIACTPACDGKECGDDGCGGQCGTGDCPAGQSCASGICTCVPNCTLGQQCGDDGCGGQCGSCPTGQTCNNEGQCVAGAGCTPSCTTKACGDDGCGGSCGLCETALVCAGGQCIDPGDGTGNGCLDILDCANGCIDDICAGACYSEGSATAQAEFDAINGCIGTNDCLDGLCIGDNCSLEMAECQFDSTGEMSCYDMLMCQTSCPQEDISCLQGCIADTTVQGQAEYIAMVYCLTHYCPDIEDMSCQQAKLTGAGECAAYYMTCLN